MKTITPFLSEEKGAELAEYAVAVALLVAIGLVVFSVLGNSILDADSGTAAGVNEASDWEFQPGP